MLVLFFREKALVNITHFFNISTIRQIRCESNIGKAVDVLKEMYLFVLCQDLLYQVSVKYKRVLVIFYCHCSHR